MFHRSSGATEAGATEAGATEAGTTEAGATEVKETDSVSRSSCRTVPLGAGATGED